MNKVDQRLLLIYTIFDDCHFVTGIVNKYSHFNIQLSTGNAGFAASSCIKNSNLQNKLNYIPTYCLCPMLKSNSQLIQSCDFYSRN